MKLDEMMRDATDDTVVDLDRLTRGASRQGRGIRRRRRLLGTTAGLAAVATSVAVVALVVPLAGNRTAPTPTPRADDAASATVAQEPPSPVGIDGRATAALLKVAVDDVADGTFGGYAGQGAPGGGSPDTYAELVLTPAQQGAGVVGINVQNLSITAGDPRSCLDFMVDCTVTRLPDGDVLRSYRDQPDAGSDIRRVAELISPSRHLRVVVSATNGFDLGGNQWDITRPDSVLSAEQLRAVAVDDRWGFEVSAEYAEQGAALTPYDDRDADRGDWISPTAPAGKD